MSLLPIRGGVCLFCISHSCNGLLDCWRCRYWYCSVVWRFHRMFCSRCGLFVVAIVNIDWKAVFDVFVVVMPAPGNLIVVIGAVVELAICQSRFPTVFPFNAYAPGPVTDLLRFCTFSLPHNAGFDPGMLALLLLLHSKDFLWSQGVV